MSTAVRQVPRNGLDRARGRARLDWTLIVGPVMTLCVTMWGITSRAYGGDEPDTISAVSRSVPQLIRMLGHVDSVHGLYYLLLWPVARLAGTGEFVTRFPSALAMAAAALGVAAIARRLVSRRAALWAGLTFAILPFVSQEGQNARPYALVTAAAALASYLFVRVVQDPRPRWFTWYGLSLVLVGYLQMFALLLVAAQVVTLIGLGWPQRARIDGPLRTVRGWLVTYAAVGLAMVPLVLIGWTQRGAIAWITRPNWPVAVSAAKMLATGSTVSVVVLAELGLLGVMCSGRLSSAWPLDRDDTVADAGRRIGWLAVPWLVLPPAVLLTVSQVYPAYNYQYITFCLPAMALLVGSGIAALRLPVRVIAFAVVAVLAVPAQYSLRVPVNGMLAASSFLNSHEKPGDAIVYTGPMIPPWSIAFPAGFSTLHDLSLKQTGAVAGTLYSQMVPRSAVEHREQGARRIWVLESRTARSPAAYLSPAFRVAHVWTLPGHIRVWLYTRHL